MHDPLTLTCQAVLFDLDGTLIDSTDRIDRLWRWWAERHGIPFEQMQGKMHGLPAVETFRLVDPNLPIEQEVEELESEEVRDMHDVRLIPGVSELLSRLRPERWAIVTSGSPRVAHARLQHTGLPLPKVLITAAEIENGKPAPDGYLLAAQLLGFDAAECIVIEDSPAGVSSGKAAGMCVVAIATTHPVEELARADVIIPSLRDLDVQTRSSSLCITLHP